MNDFSNERTVKAANITSSATESVIRTLFEFLGPVTNLQLQESPYNDGSREATVEFQEHEAAMTALHLSGTELGDRILVISFHTRVAEDPSSTTTAQTTTTATTTTEVSGTSDNTAKDVSTVHVYHLAPSTTVADLSLLFAACGAITKMTLDPDVKDRPNLRAVVDFATSQGAEAAIRLDGHMLRDKAVRIRRGEPVHQHQDGGKTGERSQSSVKNDTRRSSRERRESPTRRRSRSRDRYHSSRRRSRSSERYSRRARSRERYSSSRRRSRSTDRYSSRRTTSRDDRYAPTRRRRRSRSSTERERHSRRSPSNDKDKDRRTKSDEPTRARGSGDTNHHSSERTRSRDNWPEHDDRDGRRSSRHRSYYR